MEGQKIAEVIRTLFTSADEHNWPKLLSVIADEVYLDYSSMNNVEPSMHNHQQVLDAWGKFLGCFDRSHHRLTEFKIQLHGNEADVTYVGQADYFIGDEIWSVHGSYNTQLQKQDGKWLITLHKLNYERQSGNTGLPKLVHQRMINQNGQ